MTKALSLLLVGVAAAALQWGAAAAEAPRPAQIPTVAAPPLPEPQPAPVGTLSRTAVSLRAEPVAEGLGQIMVVTAPADDSRLFLVEKSGRILLIEDGALVDDPFLDLTTVVGSEGVEQGLVGLAFHPEYPDNGRFFVYFTNHFGDSRLVEYRVSADDADRADPRAVRLVMAVDQPHQYHNAGMLQFGPDGMLYVAFGDGGGIGDQYDNGQRTDSVLGTISRISVDGPAPYAVPVDNPFADAVGGTPEIWWYGLRNPWRFWIDGGLIYVGDVGQSGWEEIDVAPISLAGANFGWSILEGFQCFEAEDCDRSDTIDPVLVYPHGEGCAVIGGVVYRGDAIPELDGHYFYGDFCGGWVRSFRYSGGVILDKRNWETQLGDLGQILAFGTDGAGEIHVTTGSGGVYRLVAESRSG